MWEEFAGLGHEESSWVLDRHPDKILSVAQPSLHLAPEVAIPLLLIRAVGDDRNLHSSPDHPLRLIQDWAHAGRPGSGEGLSRRKALFHAASDWLSADNDIKVGLKAIGLALGLC